MEEKLIVAIQGERGSFSEEAASKLLGRNIDILCCDHFERVFQLTVEKKAEYCVIPIENSLAGSIYKNYDLLLRHRLKIIREVNLRVQHHLIVLKEVSFEQIRTVISHPMALDQCEKFFDRFGHLTKQSAYDTSGSVKRVVENRLTDVAVIAGRRAAQFYKGHILMTGIEDNKQNFTRFFLLSRDSSAPAGADKTSVVFSFKNAPGVLFKCLSAFALRDIDLTKIESRPIHGRPWEYLFYLDFLGNIEEDKTQHALDHLQEITEFLEILGCYPRDATLGKRGM